MTQQRPKTVLDRRNPGAYLREMQQQGLVAQGVAGQQAGPPGIGPEPRLAHEPGGDLLNRIQHPSFDTVEHLFRSLPEESWFSPQTSPRKPVKFEIGSFRVPDNSYFLLCDYEFTPLRQSGVDPFDFVFAEDGRFSGMIGYDINVNGRRTSNLFYQLDPAPVQFARSSFDAPSATRTAAVFNKASANSFGSFSGEGTSILPSRPNVQGARGMPFTIMAGPNSAVSLSCVIFRRVLTPLAGIQATVSGYTIHTNTLQALMERMRPR